MAHLSRPDQPDLEKLQTTYNDLLALQDQTDTVLLTIALDAVGLALGVNPSRSDMTENEAWIDWFGRAEPFDGVEEAFRAGFRAASAAVSRS